MSELPGYQAALEGAAYFVLAGPGTLFLQGADRLAFLQRQTTNDIHRLAAGRAQLSALITPMARLLDVLRLFLDGETIGILTLPGHGANTARYFKSRIFFNDQVTLSDESANWAQIDLEGPHAAGILEKIGLQAPAEMDDLVAHQSLRAIAQRGLAGAGYRVLAPATALAEVLRSLQTGGAVALSAESQHVLRVEAGLPASGAELTGEYTPLEAGLEHAVASDKGCYTGQEVIARQITYDKITQRLVGLKLESPAQPGERLWVEDKPVGTLTSTAVSPRFGALALSVVRRPYHQPGSELSLGNPAEGETRKAIVTSLPF